MANKANVTNTANAPIEQEYCPVIGGDKKVKYHVQTPRGKYKFDKFVSLNGKNFLLKPGSDVTIPKNVRDLLLKAEKAEASADDYYYSHIYEE